MSSGYHFHTVRSLGATEVVHFYDSRTEDIVTTCGSRVAWMLDGKSGSFDLPLPGVLAVMGRFRIARRLLRLDKSNIAVGADRDCLLGVYLGQLFRYDLRSGALAITGRLRQSRNTMHCGVVVHAEHGVYIGEYGANPSRAPVPIWRSVDDGQHWDVVYELPAGAARHVHGVYWDAFGEKLWVTTGDTDGECFIYVANPDFTDVIRLGDGSQRWRCVSLLFSQDRVIWGMDSEVEPARLQILDRRTGVVRAGQTFPGSIWYTKALDDGGCLLQATVEMGPGIADRIARLYMSDDGETWSEVARFEKDLWPMRYFKFGVLAFADGYQTREHFAVFGEGLRQFDGRAIIAGIQENRR